MTEFDSDQGPQFSFVSNREVRHVPLDWEHPRDEEGEIVTLFDRSRFTEETVEEYLAEGPEYTRELIESWHMPDFSNIPPERMGVCAYETTSEGTPISPIYPNNPRGRFDLVRFCAENATVFADQKCPDIEAWTGILFSRGLATVDLKSGTVSIVEPRISNPE